MSLHAVHVPTREELIRAVSNKPVSKTLKLAFAALAALGAVVFIVGAVRGEDRAWLALMFNWLFFTIIASAGVAFTAVQRLTTARWSRPVIRFVEGYVAWLPVAFVLLLVILFFSGDHIFTWAGRETIHTPQKAIYLDPTFFKLRGVVLFGLMTAFYCWYIYRSVRLDVGVTPEESTAAGWAKGIRAKMRAGFGEERRELHSTHSTLGKLAVVVCLVFGWFWPVLIWDYSMTISLHFQQTMYGWQVFMGGFLVMLMSFQGLMYFWRRHLGGYDLVTDSHLHDVGKLCFAFTAFWGYLTFSQYLVIWYGNLPEETHWPRLRLMDPWIGLSTAVVILTFVIPFFTLLSKAAKLYAPVMLTVVFCSALGIWIHRYLEIYPSVFGEAAHLPFGLWEIAIGLGMLGLFGLVYTSFMDAFPKVRVFLMTSKYRDEVQVPVDPKTMEPLPAHE
ncbi:MAG: hypothetical protein ACXW61_14915 [Gemmatirosa sp.]